MSRDPISEQIATIWKFYRGGAVAIISLAVISTILFFSIF